MYAFFVNTRNSSISTSRPRFARQLLTYTWTLCHTSLKKSLNTVLHVGIPRLQFAGQNFIICGMGPHHKLLGCAIVTFRQRVKLAKARRGHLILILRVCAGAKTLVHIHTDFLCQQTNYAPRTVCNYFPMHFGSGGIQFATPFLRCL